MTSPTDLIREANEVLAWQREDRYPLVALVRRLRDAVVDRADYRWAEWFAAERDYWMNEQSWAESDLAEANEAIDRIRVLADEWEAGVGGTVAALALRRAIEGPAREEN